MNKLLNILWLMLIFPISLLSDGVYPYTLNFENNFEGGKLYLSKQNGIANGLFVKYGLLGEQSVIYDFDFGTNSIVQGVNKEGMRVISGCIEADRLYLLSFQSDSFFLNVHVNKELVSNIYIATIPEAVYQDVSFKSKDELLLLKIGTYLYLFEFDNETVCKIHLLSEVCIHFNWVEINDRTVIAYIEDNNENCTMYFVDKKGITIHKQILPFFESITLKQITDRYILQFGSVSNDNSLIYILDRNNYLVENSFWLDGAVGFTSITDQGDFIYIRYQNGNYQIVRNNYDNELKQGEVNYSNLPKELVEPMYLKLFDDFVLTVFKNGVITHNLDMSVRSFDFLPIGRHFSQIEDAYAVDDILILTSAYNTILLVEKKNNFWLLASYYYQYGKWIIPLLLLLVIFLTLNIYRHQRRLLNTISDLPATGFLFIIDKSGRLVKTNESGAALLSLKKNIPLRRKFEDYFKIDEMLPIFSFYSQNNQTKDTINKRLSLIIDGFPKEWLCHLIPLRNIAGAYRGVILTGVDITEQLERKRLTNWAQLAHDMQTNLSTIRLNTEHLDIDSNENNKSRQKKILHQVNVLMQRIRDLITVGRNDDLNISLVESAEICGTVRSEFDEIVFPNVEFVLNVNHFSFNCDKQKLIRALRNAVENGIKALPERKGIITISCNKDNKNVYFSVADNGIGMNETIKKRFLKPYFTTAPESGGSGIGTMIMQRVAEMHKGKLIINSEEGIGTEILFVLPLAAGK